MNTNEPTRENVAATPEEPEMTQDGELSDDELETVDGGLLPAVRNKLSPVVSTPANSHGIIAVLIGL